MRKGKGSVCQRDPLWIRTQKDSPRDPGNARKPGAGKQGSRSRPQEQVSKWFASDKKRQGKKENPQITQIAQIKNRTDKNVGPTPALPDRRN